jgi:hypothetical protein
VDAAGVLGGHVQVVEIAPGPFELETLDALVMAAAPHAPPAETPALVVALVEDASAREHVRHLARDVDLVVPGSTHGRLLLATILALLRWRSRQ